jgi:biofilm PGA synthesis N-glycosyltransferase PgaC
MIWTLLIIFLPYFFILLNIWRHLNKLKSFIPAGNTSVSVSVIIACRNEEKNLPELLGRLSSQDYNPLLFEVIIVDDNSSDNTFSLVSEYKKIKFLRILSNPGSGKKQSIRAAVNTAKGDLIMTTDADCRPCNQWISTVAAYFDVTKADMIILPVQLENKPGFAGRFAELEFLSLQGVTAGTAREGNPVMCNGANLAFSRQAYLRHSGNLHDEILSGDDIFFLHSLKKESGSKIMWLNSANVVVTTSQTATIKTFLNQRARWVSKVKAFDDGYSRLISIVTFITILAWISFLVSGMISREFLLLFLAAFFLKSIPDFLILYKTTGRYNKKHLLNWFIPSQLIYPFYVITVVCRSLFNKNKWG